MPALIRKAHEAKLVGAHELQVWGSGTPRREFLHVDDCADALVFLMQRYSADEHVNVGSGEDIPIAELASLVAKAVGFEGGLSLDRTKPDGTPRKLMSGDRLKAMGWSPRVSLNEGLKAAYAWFTEHQASHQA
jgi:GDP-L-fucose synthase